MDYRPIRNKIRTFSFDSITTLILSHLKKQEGDKSRPAAIWFPLLLLRWSLEFAGDKYPPKVAVELDLIKLLKMLEELELTQKTYDFKVKGDMSKFFTVLSYQQFYYQNAPWFNSFERQYVLYFGLKTSYDISGAFQERTGLTVVEFLSALKIFWVSILKNAVKGYKYYGVLTNDHLNMVSDLLGRPQLDNIIKLFCVSRNNIRQIISEDKRLVRDYNLQIFEPSLFTRRPFLEHNGFIILPHRNVLNHTINHFIYDFMKNRDDRFSEDLGKRLEMYIELGLKENSITYLNEGKLKNLLGRDSKVVDFLIEDEILLECKAIELRPYAHVNPTDDILSNEFDQTITKAYARQMLETAHRLDKYPKYFGLVVTYKKLNLGETEDIWSHFLERESLKIHGDNSYLERIPKENLFFVDIETWDQVMQIIKNEKLTLKEILLKVQRAEERKFGFHMHLDEYQINKYDLGYLKVDDRIIGI